MSGAASKADAVALEMPADNGSSRAVRVGVFREAFWLPCDPIGLTFKDPRPAWVPPSLDRFLWGGTYTTLTQACAPAGAAAFYAYLGGSLLALFLVLCPYLFPWTFYIAWRDIGATVAYIVSVSLACLLVAWGLTRPAMAAMHRDLQTAVDDSLAPYFRRAGLLIRLQKHKPNRFRADTYLTIEPLVGRADVAGRSHLDPSVTDRRRDTIRVPAYGMCVDRAMLRRVSGSGEFHTFGTERPDAVKAAIDVFTWGAVATELHPLTSQYDSWRASATITLLASLELLVLAFVVEWHMFVPAIVFLVVFPIVGPHVERFVLHRPASATLATLAQARVRELSPTVANFSGYTLDVAVEPEACGTTSGYVIFHANAEQGWEPPTCPARQAVGATVV